MRAPERPEDQGQRDEHQEQRADAGRREQRRRGDEEAHGPRDQIDRRAQQLAALALRQGLESLEEKFPALRSEERAIQQELRKALLSLASEWREQ